MTEIFDNAVTIGDPAPNFVLDVINHNGQVSLDDYLAALINFRYIANALWTTDKAVSCIAGAGS